MKKFCVVTNSYKDKQLKIANEISDYIYKNGGTCIIIDNVDSNTGDFKILSVQDVPEDVECVISIGGDGTLLHAAKDFIDLDAVFVGVNKGTLGFLAEISPDEINTALDKLLNNQFQIESRMMLYGEVRRSGTIVYSSIVLNDIVIHRGDDLAITDYDVFVNGDMLGTYQADGVILSTPTGSTAYNLSAGGPVARPDSHMIMLTPICPHTLGNRSIIFSRSDKIEVRIGQCRTPNEERRKAAFDGDGIFNIISGDIICICEAEKATKIAKIDEGSFLQAIKDKLN